VSRRDARGVFDEQLPQPFWLGRIPRSSAPWINLSRSTDRALYKRCPPLVRSATGKP
jgi:hypothetical protein